MKSRVEVIKTSVLGDFIELDIYIDHDYEEVLVGTISVDKDGYLDVSYDNFFLVHRKNLFEKGKKALLENGLVDILGDEDAKIYIEGRQTCEDFDPVRYERAEQYIKDHNLEVENLDDEDILKI